MIGQHLVRQTAIISFIFATIAQAHSEILEFDCSDKAGVYYNIWVDLNRSTVAIHYARPGLPQELRTFPAQITDTSIHWSFGEASRATLNASIDRTTGRYFQVYGGVAQGSLTFQCVRGTSPLPGTRF
jgi:hypothetical protein